MMFSSRLSLSSLIELCRVIRHYMGSGLTLQDVFRQQAKRGAAAVRPLAERVSRSLEQGNDLGQALKTEKDAFPPLFLSLVTVGEETGNLPEICGELEKYFLLQQKLRNNFLSMIAWPVLQLNMAIFVISLLLWAMGIVAEIHGPGTKPFDPLGFGLVGFKGGLIFFLGAYGSIAALFVVYYVLTRTLQQKAAVDRFLLRMPVVGPCLRALALTRFCLSLWLTHETGMSVVNAVRLSLRATSNAAFVATTDTVLDALRRREELTVALTSARIFPEEFLHIVAVAEESGRLSEVMQHQTQQYEQESMRRLTMLNMAASFAVWCFVAILIIIAIFRIALFYIGMIDAAADGKF
jgi:type IV pilus assembly protein PilC